MPPGRRITTRVDPSIEQMLTKVLPWKELPHLLRCLLVLAATSIDRDPFLLSEILVGAQRPSKFELRIYKTEEPE
jgi:hypothetical protein